MTILALRTLACVARTSFDGTHTFKVSSSTDPENTETTETSVFMIADYNENLDKNICLFLNELLGYGHAYSESAIL